MTKKSGHKQRRRNNLDRFRHAIKQGPATIVEDDTAYAAFDTWLQSLGAIVGADFDGLIHKIPDTSITPVDGMFPTVCGVTAAVLAIITPDGDDEIGVHGWHDDPEFFEFLHETFGLPICGLCRLGDASQLVARC